MSLFWRIFLLNAVVLIAATAVLLLGPVTVSTPVLLAEVLVLVAGLVAMLVANAILLRVGLAPLDRLTRAMTTIDLLRPTPRPRPAGRGEVAVLIRTFNEMLDRLEAERSESNARALSAQEAERQRVAEELHDEVGQSLTAVLLELKRVSDQADEQLRTDLRHAQETTRASLDEIRRITRRLRPGVLEELGLVSALTALVAELAEHTGITARHRFDGDLPELNHETELVLYRVAQESLTNAARHSGAGQVGLALHCTANEVTLRIDDDGIGIEQVREGAGIRGMRERALLVGAELTVAPGAKCGTNVSMRVAVQDGASDYAR